VHAHALPDDRADDRVEAGAVAAAGEYAVSHDSAFLRHIASDFDLQSHSTYSDGALPPAEVVARGAAAGLRLLALTDHDTVDGVDEALAAGRDHGVAVVPATELSTADAEHGELHVLGYRVDHHDPALTAALERFRNEREGRAGRMAAALREAGIEVDDAPLEHRRAAGLSIGRPHLAEAALAHPANADRLREEACEDVSPFIEAYLIPGRPGFRERALPSVADAVALIHAAGGLAVWAHPFWDLDAPDEVEAAAGRFAAMGIDGIEAFYVTHTREETLLAVAACERHGLLTTGSADFHGPGHRLFSRFGAFELHGLTPNLGPIGQ
jgi:predicted metal-dependent phosphoesterase TrpH